MGDTTKAKLQIAMRFIALHKSFRLTDWPPLVDVFDKLMAGEYGEVRQLRSFYNDVTVHPQKPQDPQDNVFLLEIDINRHTSFSGESVIFSWVAED